MVLAFGLSQPKKKVRFEVKPRLEIKISQIDYLKSKMVQKPTNSVRFN